MILKIKACGTNQSPDDMLLVTDSWRFFDRVEGLHFNKYVSENQLRVAASGWATPSDVQEIWMTEDKPVDGAIIFMSFDSDRTGPIHVFCNTECYLLNDQGKTIERLI